MMKSYTESGGVKEGTMNCPVCGHALTPVLEVLAESSTGTQCPKCWMPVRHLPGGSKNRRRGAGHATKRAGTVLKTHIVT